MKQILAWLQQISRWLVLHNLQLQGSMIELPANAEKGLSQRFIWTFPRPTYAEFETLEPVNSAFSTALGKYNHAQVERLCTLSQFVSIVALSTLTWLT